MRSKKLKISILLFFFVFYVFLLDSCKPGDSKSKKNINPYEEAQISDLKKINDYILAKTGEKRFFLDDTDTRELSGICYFEENNNEYFSFLDYLSQKISIFNYKDGLKIKTVPLFSEGPNSVGKIDFSMSFVMLSLDSIFVINTWVDEIILLNGNGIKSKSYSIDNKTIENQSIDDFSFINNQLKKIRNKIFIQTSPSDPSLFEFDFTQLPSLITLDLNNGDLDHIFRMPPIYNTGFWSKAVFKYLPNFCYLESKDIFLLGFTVDPLLYKIDTRSLRIKEKLYCGSQFFTDPEPMSDNVLDYKNGISDEKSNEYALTQSDFTFLIEEPVSGKILRTTYIRPSETTYQSGPKALDFSFIIISPDPFQVVGETKFEGELHYPSYHFSNKYGFHLARFEGDENKFIFDIYQVQKSGSN